MKTRWPAALVVALVACVMVGLARQRRENAALRSELELAQMEAGELPRLQAENKRLHENQISPAALDALRADHAALPRLRSELEALNRTQPTTATK